MGRVRLDQLLVERGLCASRSQARAVIMAGKVFSGTRRLEKPGQAVTADLPVEVRTGPQFVGRGAEKLKAFCDETGIGFAGCRLLDVGASTGGFTDYALQSGAVRAFCIDVGRNQLHPRLQADPRVHSIEGLNARLLRPDDLPERDFVRIVIDVSFISLRLVLPPVWPLLAPGGLLIALVKPQFEAGREEVSRGGGVIRDDAVRERVLEEITSFALQDLPGAEVSAAAECRIPGADGNREFFLALRKAPAAPH
ncbi:MAG: TlyA family RNA methyltransferase [Puniceicoccaceae bacterium]|nr:MAG: TlyA family RNA methyltransferase [Puniceicoccaceae bacterium]